MIIPMNSNGIQASLLYGNGTLELIFAIYLAFMQHQNVQRIARPSPMLSTVASYFLVLFKMYSTRYFHTNYVDENMTVLVKLRDRIMMNISVPLDRSEVDLGSLGLPSSNRFVGAFGRLYPGTAISSVGLYID